MAAGHAARAEGIGPSMLADFLGLEHGGELFLLGQDEVDSSLLEAEFCGLHRGNIFDRAGSLGS